MINGFEFFKTRQYNIESSIAEIEQKLNLKLPPLYRCCLGIFDLSENATIKTKLGDFDFPICSKLFKNPYTTSDEDFLYFDRFCPPHEIIERNSRGLFEIEKYEELKLIVIGDCMPAYCGIFLSTAEDTKDEIWIFDTEYFDVEQPSKIAGNIFEFIQMFYAVPTFNESVQNKLFKKYGDEYWKFTEIEINESPVPRGQTI